MEVAAGEKNIKQEIDLGTREILMFDRNGIAFQVESS